MANWNWTNSTATNFGFGASANYMNRGNTNSQSTISLDNSTITAGSAAGKLNMNEAAGDGTYATLQVTNNSHFDYSLGSGFINTGDFQSGGNIWGAAKTSRAFFKVDATSRITVGNAAGGGTIMLNGGQKAADGGSDGAGGAAGTGNFAVYDLPLGNTATPTNGGKIYAWRGLNSIAGGTLNKVVVNLDSTLTPSGGFVRAADTTINWHGSGFAIAGASQSEGILNLKNVSIGNIGFAASGNYMSRGGGKSTWTLDGSTVTASTGAGLLNLIESAQDGAYATITVKNNSHFDWKLGGGYFETGNFQTGGNLWGAQKTARAFFNVDATSRISVGTSSGDGTISLNGGQKAADGGTDGAGGAPGSGDFAVYDMPLGNTATPTNGGKIYAWKGINQIAAGTRNKVAVNIDTSLLPSGGFVRASDATLDWHGGGITMANQSLSNGVLNLKGVNISNFGASTLATNGGQATVNMTNSTISGTGDWTMAGATSSILNLSMNNSVINRNIGNVTIGNNASEKVNFTFTGSNQINIKNGTLSVRGNNGVGIFQPYAFNIAGTPTAGALYLNGDLTIANASTNRVQLTLTNGGSQLHAPGGLGVANASDARGTLIVDGSNLRYTGSGTFATSGDTNTQSLITLANSGSLGFTTGSTIRNNASTSATIQGAGTFDGGDSMTTNGRFLASGGTLNVDHGTLAQGTQALAMGDTNLAGWYAQSSGKLALKGIDVAGAAAGVTWGDDVGDITRDATDLVNSTRITFTGATAGKLHGGMAATGLVTGLTNPIAVYEFNPALSGGVGFTNATLQFRYDHIAAGVNENLIEVFKFNTGTNNWDLVTLGGSRNTTTKQISTTAQTTLGLYAIATAGGAGTGTAINDFDGNPTGVTTKVDTTGSTWGIAGNWDNRVPTLRDTAEIGSSALATANITLNNGVTNMLKAVKLGTQTNGTLTVTGAGTRLAVDSMELANVNDGQTGVLNVESGANVYVAGSVTAVSGRHLSTANVKVDNSSMRVARDLTANGRNGANLNLSFVADNSATVDIAGKLNQGYVNTTDSTLGSRNVSSLNGSVVNVGGDLELGGNLGVAGDFPLTISGNSQLNVGGNVRVSSTNAIFRLPLTNIPTNNKLSVSTVSGLEVYRSAELLVATASGAANNLTLGAFTVGTGPPTVSTGTKLTFDGTGGAMNVISGGQLTIKGSSSEFTLRNTTLTVPNIDALVDIDLGALNINVKTGSVLNVNGNFRFGRERRERFTLDLDSDARINILGNLSLNGGTASNGLQVYNLPLASTPANGKLALTGSGSSIILGANHGTGGGAHVEINLVSGSAASNINIGGSLTLGDTVSAESNLTVNGVNLNFGTSGVAASGSGTSIVQILNNGNLGFGSTFTVRNSNSLSARVQGRGTLNVGTTLTNNGRIIADGGNLTITAQSLTSGVESAGILVTQPGAGFERAGWSAINGGRLNLPSLAVAANTATTWGELSSDTSPDLVNSMRLTSLSGMSSAQTLSGSVLAPTNIAVPAGLYKPVSIFEFSGLTFSTAQMQVRYDDILAGTVGAFQPRLKLLHYVGGVWQNVTSTASGAITPGGVYVNGVDTTANKWIVSDTTSITSLSPFAVAQAATPLTAYWTGDESSNWTTDNSADTNWATNAPGTVDAEAIPGTVSDVFFTADSASTPVNTTLGADFSVKSITFTGGVTTAGSNSVTIGGANMLTVGIGGMYIQSGSAAHTISSNMTFGTNFPGWNNDSSNLFTISGNITNGSVTAAIAGTGNSLISGNVSGGGSLVKNGVGTLTMSGTNSYIGTTTVNQGKMLVNGTHTGGGLYTVNNGGTLGGSGSISAAVVVNSGGTLSPGNSPGTFGTGAETWNSGGNLLFEINDATGTAGIDPGWDLLAISGSLNLSALSAGNEFNIELTSLTLGNVGGNAANFSAAGSYAWLFADATSTIGTYTGDDQFLVDTTAFTNTFTGQFSVLRGDNPLVTALVAGANNTELYLYYANAASAVPEPNTYALGLIGLVGMGLFVWRKRRNK